jgi:hypothetical protein
MGIAAALSDDEAYSQIEPKAEGCGRPGPERTKLGRSR